MRILVADIGGTNSRFAFFIKNDEGDFSLVKKVSFATTAVNSFTELLDAVNQSDLGLQLCDSDVCIFAVAGQIIDPCFCSPPNITWCVDLSEAQTCFGIKQSVLINDFLAQAYACSFMKSRTLVVGKRLENSPIAVVGAGTGLGKAFLLKCDGGLYKGFASEGGHVSFSAESKKEFGFQEFALKEFGLKILTFDDVVSGRGLSVLHNYLYGEELTPEETASRFIKCPQTLTWFSRFYGRACRNFALEVLPLGGLYISGGIAAKNPVIVENKEFYDSFCDSLTYSEMLSQIPIHLLEDQDAGLYGAAYYAGTVFYRDR